jgi:peptide/nickel transport system substrate-binding protein
MAYALLEILEILRRAATFPGATNMTNSFNRSDIDRRRFLQTGVAAGLATGFCGIDPVLAQSRAETLLVVQELGPNSLDMQGVGSNQTVNGLSWNCYDRLLSYASKTLPDGTLSYDRAVLAPELAEKWEIAADGMSCTFYLCKDATFHDGTPVTAKDVKWSFDRAVKVGGFPTFQMSAGSLEKPEQFVVVDDHTFRIDYIRKDKMLLFNVAVVVPFVINSELAKKNATESDPWAMQWLKVNEAGGGAYKIESWKAGSETIFARFDNWKSGPLPTIKRVIARDVPSPGTRRAMLERGDADFSTGFPPRDFEQLIKEGKLKVSGVPIPNALWYIALNTSRPPFDNPKLRQAIAFAMPYEQIQANAFFGRAVPMYGGPAAVEKAIWPQAFPYVTDLDKAKALMKEAGVEGLETTLSLDVGTATVGEPTALLIQESLAKIGIKAAVEKIPGANWRTTLNKKELPMALNRFSGWLDYPEYYFFWNFHGNNSIFNISAYKSKEMDALIDKARFTTDPAEYDAAVKAFITLCIKDVPVVPLNQPIHDVASQKNVSGYEFWFHREPDYRRFTKA